MHAPVVPLVSVEFPKGAAVAVADGADKTAVVEVTEVADATELEVVESSETVAKTPPAGAVADVAAASVVEVAEDSAAAGDATVDEVALETAALDPPELELPELELPLAQLPVREPELSPVCLSTTSGPGLG